MEETNLKINLHHVESFLNVFPGDHGEMRKVLCHLYVGLSDEVPVPNEEVEEFQSWAPDELKIDIARKPDSYVPSFAVELDKALVGYKKIWYKS